MLSLGRHLIGVIVAIFKLWCFNSIYEIHFLINNIENNGWKLLMLIYTTILE